MSMNVNDGVDLSAVRYVALAARDGNNFIPNTSHEGAAINIDYRTAISVSAIEGHSIFRGFGYRAALSTVVTGDDVWQGAATSCPIPDQSTGEQMTIKSTDIADDAAGANVRKIHHHYIDINGNEQVEEMIMDGTTEVDTIATNIRFSQYMHTTEIGAFGGVAAGDITIYKKGSATTVYNVIKAGGNMSLNTSRMIPVNKEYFMDSVTVTGASGKPLSIRLRATCSEEGTLTPGIFLFNEILSSQDSGLSINRTIPKRFPALTIIKASVYSLQAGGEATVSYSGWLE